jgi:hypothetical protein
MTPITEEEWLGEDHPIVLAQKAKEHSEDPNKAGPREHRVIGPPGCGKTTYLTRQANLAAEKVGPSGVLIASLTRAAAREVAGRKTVIPEQNIGTLHAHCFRALDRPNLAETSVGLKAWNEWVNDQGLGQAWQMNPGTKADIDHAPLEADQNSATAGEDARNVAASYRARMIPPGPIWPERILHFHTKWCEWKAEAGRVDFTDLIEKCIQDQIHPPSNPAIMMLDEAQDMSRLEMTLARMWGNRCEQLVIVGDPEQCQPAGTMVRTTSHGDVPIEKLDPTVHRLVSFDRHSSVLTGRRDGYAFEITSRVYGGELATVRAIDEDNGVLRTTRTTHDHRWPVKWAPQSREKLVVYLMRHERWWRVGWCKLHGSTGLHLGARARLERADAWILAYFDDRREASIYETQIAVNYGLPMPTFRERDVYQALDTRFAGTGIEFEPSNWRKIRKRAYECLADHHRDPRQPFYDFTAKHQKQGKRASLIVRACNLDTGMFQVAVPNADGRTCTWVPLTVTRERCDSTRVWSMNVEPHHNYIADGIVTQNNLFEWRGSEPGAFFAAETVSETTLSQSYRVPAAVHRYAVDWIRTLREPRHFEYEPRDEPGEMRQLTKHGFTRPHGLIEELQVDMEKGTVMVLASCGYMLNPLIAVLRKQGIPFHNPYRLTHGGWNPMRGTDRLTAFLRPDPKTWGERARVWSWEDVRLFTEPLVARGLMTRGSKELIKSRCIEDRFGDKLGEAEFPLAMLNDLFIKNKDCEKVLDMDVDWWEKHLLGSRRDRMLYGLEMYRTMGGAVLLEVPKLIVGTVHSVKGGEADSVYVFPDLSKAGYVTGWDKPLTRDPTIRMFYVAFTRAREKLTLLPRAGSFAATFPQPAADLSQGSLDR